MAELNPDFLIEGLRAELREVESLPDLHPTKSAQVAAINAEIERADRLDRPAATVEEPDRTVPDTRGWYLDALHAEKATSHQHRHAEIDAEIARVEAEHNSPAEVPDEAPTPTPTTRARRAPTSKE